MIWAPVSRGQTHELGVHSLDVRVVGAVDAHRPGAVLQTLDEVEAAAAADALLGVGGVGQPLEFLDDEARDEQFALDEARVDDLKDAPVDDRARVEELRRRQPRNDLEGAPTPSSRRISMCFLRGDIGGEVAGQQVDGHREVRTDDGDAHQREADERSDEESDQTPPIATTTSAPSPAPWPRPRGRGRGAAAARARPRADSRRRGRRR